MYKLHSFQMYQFTFLKKDSKQINLEMIEPITDIMVVTHSFTFNVPRRM